MRHAQQTCFTQLISPLQPCSPTRRKNKKKTNQGKTRGRHPSANRERQPRQISFMRQLDYTSRFVRVIPTLSPNQSSHNSIGLGGRKIWLSQHRHLNTPPQLCQSLSFSQDSCRMGCKSPSSSWPPHRLLRCCCELASRMRVFLAEVQVEVL